MSLVRPEHWYMLFWTLGGLIALAPFYYAAYRIVSLLDEIRFILSVTQKGSF